MGNSSKEIQNDDKSRLEKRTTVVSSKLWVNEGKVDKIIDVPLSGPNPSLVNKMKNGSSFTARMPDGTINDYKVVNKRIYKSNNYV